MARTAVNVTGTSPQTIAVAPGVGFRNVWLGHGITSNSTCRAIIKSGSTVLFRINLPGGEVRLPTRDWELFGGDNEALTIESDTGSVQIDGDVTYTKEATPT